MGQSQPIIEFSADRSVVSPGGHATLRWRVEGVKAVYLLPEGEPWQEHGVIGQGEKQVSPPVTTTYHLRVVKVDGSAEVRKIQVQVRTPEPALSFSVDRTEIDRGECVTFRWHVEGVKAVYFFPEGARWKDHGVVGVGEKQVCPAHTTNYRLRIVKRDESVEVHQIQILVRMPKAAQTLWVDKTDIDPGECATFRWRVEGVKAVYFYPDSERWQDHGVVGVGERQVCPPQTTSYCLRVVNRDDSVEVHRIEIHVRAPRQSQPFSVDRMQVGRGECVTFRWHVEGVKAVYFYPDSERWQDHGVVGIGQKQVCPTQTTTYCLRVICADDAIEMHYITVQVSG